MNSGFQLAQHGHPCVLFLFQGWVLDTPAKYVAGLLGTVVLGILHHGLVSLREYAEHRLKKCDPMVVRMAKSTIYGTQMVVAYWLMLLVMLYESLFFAAVVIGLTLGYFLLYNTPKASSGAHTGKHGGSPCCGGSSESTPILGKS